jgi:AcrR family transcriptional regulator
MTRSIGQHHGDLRRALLDAALALVAEGELAELTLRAVARKAGVSPGAPYHHFPDKTALLAEVAREGFAALLAVQAEHHESDPGDRLEAMSTSYVRFSLAHATHYAVMFASTPSEVEGPGADTLRDTAMATFLNLLGAILAANPALSPDEGRARALLAWAQAHGAVQVARWAASLDPTFDADIFAIEVGRAVRRIAEAPPDVADGSQTRSTPLRAHE